MDTPKYSLEISIQAYALRQEDKTLREIAKILEINHPQTIKILIDNEWARQRLIENRTPSV